MLDATLMPNNILLLFKLKGKKRAKGQHRSIQKVCRELNKYKRKRATMRGKIARNPGPKSNEYLEDPRRKRKNQQTKEIPKIGDQNSSFISTFVLKVLNPQKYNHFSHIRNSTQDMTGQTSCCYPFPMLFKLTFPNNNACRTKQQVTDKLIIFFSFYLFFFLS